MRFVSLRDIALVALLVFSGAQAQSSTNGGTGSSLPNSCSVGSIFVRTSDATLHVCSATDTWSQVGGGGSSVPAGSILMVDTGSCPAGFTEHSSLGASRFPMGTVAANGDAGGTGGANTFTPAGTNSIPTFSGTPFSSVINHTHTVTVNDPGHTHVQRIINSGTAGTVGTQGASGASNANASNSATASGTTGITASTANPAGGVASITPAGTVSAPTFTGNSADQRPAFLKVIFCKKT